jgi:hypothetical protein
MNSPLNSILPRTLSPPPRPKAKPRRKTQRKEWDTPMRQRINTLRYTKLCKKFLEISQLTGVPRQTVIDICERDEHLLRRARPSRALIYAISREIILQIEKDMEGHWSRGSMSLEELIEYYGLKCTSTTLLNAFRREGIGHFWAAEDKYLTQKNMRGREDFCKELRD